MAWTSCSTRKISGRQALDVYAFAFLHGKPTHICTRSFGGDGVGMTRLRDSGMSFVAAVIPALEMLLRLLFALVNDAPEITQVGGSVRARLWVGPLCLSLRGGSGAGLALFF